MENYFYFYILSYFIPLHFLIFITRKIEKARNYIKEIQCEYISTIGQTTVVWIKLNLYSLRWMNIEIENCFDSCICYHSPFCSFIQFFRFSIFWLSTWENLILLLFHIKVKPHSPHIPMLIINYVKFVYWIFIITFLLSFFLFCFAPLALVSLFGFLYNFQTQNEYSEWMCVWWKSITFN